MPWPRVGGPGVEGGDQELTQDLGPKPHPAIAPDPLPSRLEGVPPKARAFAQLLKRATWDHYRSRVVSDDEARAMQRLAECLRPALAEHGYAPR
ncbi:DUF7706 family protein [Acidiferrobacter thiooxydans]